MVKWVKRLSKIFGILAFLYLFGNFRINDVNVRDKLREMVPPDQLKVAASYAGDAAIYLYEKVDGFFSGKSSVSSSIVSKSLPSQISKADSKQLVDALQQLDNPLEQTPSNAELQKLIKEISNE